MCKWCDKELYYDEYYHQSDGGYGDDDIDELEKNELFQLFCCPVCGKIKPDAIKKYGSIEKALQIILCNNLNGISREDFNSILNTLKICEKEEIDEFLKINDFYIKDAYLYHSCGKRLFEVPTSFGSIYTPNTIFAISNLINKNDDVVFCSKCGEKLKPIKEVKISEQVVDEPFSILVDNKRI